MDIATVTIKFTEHEVSLLINSLETTIDSEAPFSAIPKDVNKLLEDFRSIANMIKNRKHEARVDRRLPPIFTEDDRNRPKVCENCDD